MMPGMRTHPARLLSRGMCCVLVVVTVIHTVILSDRRHA
jgi:hypothetical protein